MSTEPASRPPRPLWPWLLLPALALAGAWGWHQRQAALRAQHATLAGLQQTLDALQERQSRLREGQRGQLQRLQQAEATNRVLREELLGLGQRAALLEDSLARLADPRRDGMQALRLDEAELLLDTGLQRLRLAGDLDGARRAYALAANVLESIEDPDYRPLRQVLADERTDLDAVGADPRTRALEAVALFGRELDAAPVDAAPATPASWWRRLLAPVVRVRPSGSPAPVVAADRTAVLAAVQLEIGLARAAAERRDPVAWRGALTRLPLVLARLGPSAPRLAQWRDRLQALSAMPLSPTLPSAGATLAQLRQMRAGR